MTKKISPFLLFLLLVLLIVSACEPLGQPSQPSSTPVATPDSLTVAEPTPIAPTPTATDQPLEVWFDPSLPSEILQGGMSDFIAENSANKEEASYQLTFAQGTGLSQWIFALVAPFATVPDAVTSAEFLGFWQDRASFPANELVVDETALAALRALFGEPQGNIKLKAAGEILDYCTANSGVWAVIPFEKIEPKWKVIAIDGQSPIQKAFDPAIYPLTAAVALLMDETKAGNAENMAQIAVELQPHMPASNRDENKLTTVILTGVTALTRATAKEMELYGVLSPAASIGELMREADIAHVSNEVPFAHDCPAPQWVQENDLIFCSDVKYIDLMREIGTDVVELTGDHFADWGPEAMYLTLEMYRNEGWKYYGGGWDIDEARLPLKMEHNGNKIAFLGCNAKAPGYATASASVPGALHCDMDDMAAKVELLRKEGYMVIVTFQHQEIYRWNPTEDMVADSRRVADAGATIVSGSQAHQPHIYEFFDNTFIHYGLGNLFFDQLGWFDDSNKAFLDRHVFYDGRYLGVELLTVQFFNWSTPTLMTPEAREDMLIRLFEYSQNQ